MSSTKCFKTMQLWCDQQLSLYSLKIVNKCNQNSSINGSQLKKIWLRTFLLNTKFGTLLFTRYLHTTCHTIISQSDWQKSHNTEQQSKKRTSTIEIQDFIPFGGYSLFFVKPLKRAYYQFYVQSSINLLTGNL